MRVLLMALLCLVASTAIAGEGVPALAAADFEAKVTQAEGPVVVDFFATWCGPCVQMAPILAKVAAANPQVATFSVDVDQAQELSQTHKIQYLPTLVVFKGGVEVARHVGGQDEAALKALYADLAK
ncbi:MAG: thioredoxin family protein [Planctomycetota bacterium]|jgi:thioredoxin 1